MTIRLQNLTEGNKRVQTIQITKKKKERKRTSLHCNTSPHYTTLHPTTLHYTYRHFIPSQSHRTTLSFVLTLSHFLQL